MATGEIGASWFETALARLLTMRGRDRTMNKVGRTRNA
jgi:hypothetical protein